ncbi:MAG: hypothetical protein ABI606_03515 [Rhodoferax sp.]
MTIKTDSIPANAKPLPHTTMRSNHFIALERGGGFLRELDSLGDVLEGIKNFVETRRNYKNDVFIALAREYPLLLLVTFCCRFTE